MHPWVGLSDHVRLGVVTRWVSPELVAEVLEKCGVRDKKPGALPAGFMVYFTLALALFQQDSYDDVAEQLVGGVGELSESITNKSSFTRARRRLGPLVLETVFRELAGPLAPVGLAGAFYRGMRLAAVDGFVLDVPDTTANRAAFGGPVKNSQPAGFPQARVVTLTECSTHAQIDCGGGRFQRRRAGVGDQNGRLGRRDAGAHGPVLSRGGAVEGVHQGWGAPADPGPVERCGSSGRAAA
ncbi:transposase domain-containing protein [Streptomyces sp. YGL11-2]